MKKKSKIVFEANLDTNYVFHMLSVATCGYDNDYGKKYRIRYDAKDLESLKRHEGLLTVCGGQFIGDLYYLLIIVPARALGRVEDYYKKFLRMDDKDFPEEYKKYQDQIREICKVMVRYYRDYAEHIWPTERVRIEKYIKNIQERFDRGPFSYLAEQAVGVGLSTDVFVASMVSSVQGGAEAIDISERQDVFGIERDETDAFYFIGHEYIIYLLKEALKGEDAFQSFETWLKTEGLAEYYLKLIMGDTRFFNEQQEYVRLYERSRMDGCHTAVELFRSIP